jgi:uncharacterized repeat protein (TIGR01451 family)
MNGQIDASGAFSIPQSNLSSAYGPFDSTVVSGEDLTFNVSTDFTSLSGTLDPSTGAATMATSIFASIPYDISGVFGELGSGTCSIGSGAGHLPITLTTDAPGVPYSDQTGAVTMAVGLGSLSCSGPSISDLGSSIFDGSDQLILSGTMAPVLLPNERRIALSATSLDFGQQVVGSTSPARSVTVTNSGTANVTVSGASAGGGFAADASSCTAQPLPAGQSCVVSLTFTPAATGPQSGTLTITSDAASSPDTVALTGTGLAPSADLSVSIGATPNPVHKQKNLTYAITVYNAGASAAAAVLAVDQLPASVQFQSLSGPAGASCVKPAAGATGTVKCSLGALAAGASAQLRIVTTAVAAKGATIANTVQVSSSTSDPDPRDNQATVSTAVQ